MSTKPVMTGLYVDVAEVYAAVRREQTLKGKESEHKAAVDRMHDVIYTARLAWNKAGGESDQS